MSTKRKSKSRASRVAASADPSVEPLSTTMTSNLTPSCAPSDRRHSSRRERRFQLTTTTETGSVSKSAMDCSIIAATYGILAPPMGEMLRAERNRQGRTLQEVARATCINDKYLEAIEADDYSPIPGYFFLRAFVLQYARYLGMDEGQFRQHLDAIKPQEENPLAALIACYQPMDKQPPVPKVSSTAVAAIFLALALLLGSTFSTMFDQDSSLAPAGNAVETARL